MDDHEVELADALIEQRTIGAKLRAGMHKPELRAEVNASVMRVHKARRAHEAALVERRNAETGQKQG